jgi:hypothetical protein
MGILLTNPDESMPSHYWEIGSPEFVASPSLVEAFSMVKASKPKVFIKQPFVSERRATQTMIICGDCSGDGLLPRKTFQTGDERCDGCGGRSFVLATEVEVSRRVALALKATEVTVS